MENKKFVDELYEMFREKVINTVRVIIAEDSKKYEEVSKIDLFVKIKNDVCNYLNTVGEKIVVTDEILSKVEEELETVRKDAMDEFAQNIIKIIGTGSVDKVPVIINNYVTGLESKDLFSKISIEQQVSTIKETEVNLSNNDVKPESSNPTAYIPYEAKEERVGYQKRLQRKFVQPEERPESCGSSSGCSAPEPTGCGSSSGCA